MRERKTVHVLFFASVFVIFVYKEIISKICF